MVVDRLLVLGIATILGLAVVLLFYIDRRFPQKEKKSDPLVKALFMSLAVLFVVYMAVFFGVWDNQWVKDNFWLFFVLWVGLAIFYYTVAMKRKPLPPDKLFKIATRWVDYFYQADPVAEDATYWDLSKMGTYHYPDINPDSVGFLQTTLLFPRKVKGHFIFNFLVTLDRYTGDVTKIIMRPSVHLVDRLEHDMPVPARDYMMEEFNVEEQ